MRYIYTVWLRDLTVPESDPDYEWPACFLIDGKNNDSCREWGDSLAKRYAEKSGNLFLFSEIEDIKESKIGGFDKLPVIKELEDVHDEVLGW